MTDFDHHFLLNKRTLMTAGLFTVIGILIFRETSAWRKFEWNIFYANARYIGLGHAIATVILMYAGFLLRAVRWSIFLRPMKTVPAKRLFGPTIVGFTGLSLLGRPGELVRPYMIGTKENLSISSQLAVLMLERIFDVAASGILILAAILTSSDLLDLPYMAQLRRGGSLLVGFVALLAVCSVLLARNSERFGVTLKRLLAPISRGLSYRAGEMANAFGAGLNVILDARSLAQIVALSFSIWLVIVLAILENLHAFGGLRRISLSQALLLLGFSLLGSLVQVPGGGPQQVLTIAVLVNVFGVSPELAVSSTILGWITIFMAPVPVGLVLLRQERFSLRSLMQTIQQPKEA
jgi:glycosyltransferase 2 family protein